MNLLFSTLNLIWLWLCFDNSLSLSQSTLYHYQTMHLSIAEHIGLDSPLERSRFCIWPLLESTSISAQYVIISYKSIN
jgi:hypothetical protein